MKCKEYQAKAVFRKYDIPVPQSVLVSSPGELASAFDSIGFPSVLKAQVLTGGRGKAGGIKIVESPEEGIPQGEKLLKSEIKGLKVKQVLLEEKINVAREYYVGIITDRDAYCPMAIVSSRGGMDVEEVSKTYPDKISKKHVDFLYGLQEYDARHLAYSCGIAKEDINSVVKIITKLYALYKGCDAELTEINPLVVSTDGLIVAADGRLNIDDMALYRQPELAAYKEVENEKEAAIKYIDVGGNIGIISSGAGMTMTVMDQVAAVGGKPANFLDGGLGLLSNASKIGLEIFVERGVDSILFSTYTGGRSDVMAQKFVEAIESMPDLNIPIIVRFQGLNQEEAEKIVSSCTYDNIHIAHGIDESAKTAVKLARR